MEYYSIFAPFITKLISFKRSLGFIYRSEYPWKQLDEFLFQEVKESYCLPRKAVEKWCQKRPNENQNNLVHRCQVMRQFSLFMTDMGYPSFIPLPQKKPEAFIPYIYTQTELNHIFEQSDKLAADPDCRKKDKHIYPVFFRLLYSTGLRRGEAGNLTVRDVDLQCGIIHVKNSKNDHDRMVPLSKTMWRILKSYSRKFNQYAGDDQPFFRTQNDNSLHYSAPYNAFREILQRVGIPFTGGRRGPRVHDLRHTAAVESMAQICRQGYDIYYALPVLSKYLGHKNLNATEGYVRLTQIMYPDLIRSKNSICPSLFPEVSHEQISN